MKKKSLFKKLSAIFMSLLTIATMIPTMFAVGAATDTALIDRTQEGKATLHITKYEIEDKDVYTSLSHFGTGEQETKKSDGGNIPNEAKPFKDVTFKIYKISDLDTAMYYLKDGKKLPTADDVTKAQLNSATVVKEATTDSNGIATFSNLQLGLYYVEEISHPTQVLEKCAPFVVSIPTTSDSGDKWLYDVYAYPKNETQYADVTINKQDIVENKSLANVGFTLEESVDNQTNWTAVAGGTNNVYYTDTTGAFTWSHLPAQRYYRINEVSVPDAKYICNDDEYIVFYINSAGEVEMQNQSSLSFGTALEVNGDATNTITINNDYITTDKFIMNGTTQGKDGTAKIGDNVNWQLTATVPEEMSKMTKYDIIDTMSTGLKYVSATISGLDEEGKTVYAFVENTDYTITNSETTNKKVTFAFSTTGCKRAVAVNVKTIVVNYTTLVTADAPLGTAISNSSSVTYSNKFTTTSTFTTTTSNPPEVHTSGFQFKKVNSNNTALQGATFKLYATMEDAQAGTNALTFYTYENGKLVQTSVATSDENGLVSFMGLTYGTFGNKVNEGTTKYYVVETSTPTGYNLLKDPFEITVGQNSYSYTNTKFDVVNTSKLNLPKTGVIAGTGVAGVGIVCLGIALAFAMKKKKNNKTSD